MLLLYKNYNNENKINLFNELDCNYRAKSLQKLQMVVALCYNGNNLKIYLNNLKSYIVKFNETIVAICPDIISAAYQRSRFFSNILNYCIYSALEIERADLIDEILISYCDVKNPKEKLKTAYFIFTNQFVFCLPEKNIINPAISDIKNILKNIVDVENKAFNNFRLLKGGLTDINVTDKEVGLPVAKYGKEYEDKLNILYDFRIIKSKMNGLESLIQFDFNGFPIQALMIKQINRSLPIDLSLTKKSPFSKIEKVLFWQGSSLTSQIEAEALKEIFNNKNIYIAIVR